MVRWRRGALRGKSPCGAEWRVDDDEWQIHFWIMVLISMYAFNRMAGPGRLHTLTGEARWRDDLSARTFLSGPASVLAAAIPPHGPISAN